MRLASPLIGMEVLDLAGEDVGLVKDLAIDGASGKVAFAVLAVDALDRRVAMPLDAFVVACATSSWTWRARRCRSWPAEKCGSALQFFQRPVARLPPARCVRWPGHAAPNG